MDYALNETIRGVRQCLSEMAQPTLQIGEYQRRAARLKPQEVCSLTLAFALHGDGVCKDAYPDQLAVRPYGGMGITGEDESLVADEEVSPV